jgi:type VI secretion system protein ImpG
MLGSQEDLLLYYQRELTYLRKMGQSFAEKYPKIAGRLELGPEQSQDPNVERLLESFAFLTGRVQLSIENEFPEIGNALLGILYPHLLNPVPSMGIARLEPDPKQGIPSTGYLVPKETPVFAQSNQGEPCRFRTSYPVRLWPVDVSYAGFESTDKYEFLDSVSNVATVLRLRVESKAGALNKMDLDSLRFYLNGELTTIYEIYELLFAHTQDVALLPEGSKAPILLSRNALSPVGFEQDENVIPCLPYSHPGYRLLQEYFTFCEKFMFFDVGELGRQGSKKYFDILFLLDQRPREHIVVSRDTFVLGCTPIINLFSKTTDPIRLDHRKTEYLLHPDHRRERTTEIYSINKVSSSNNALDETQVYEPFYSFTHRLEENDHKTFWHGRRVPTGRKDMPGTHMQLTFLDLDFQPAKPPTEVVFAHTLCTNRGLAEELPENAKLQTEFAAPIADITCIKRPSPQLESNLSGASLWKLVSQLSLNHLSLTGDREGLKALQEILRLYSFSNRLSTDQQIMGIREMSCEKVVRHVGLEGWRGFCRGTEITLRFDEQQYVGSSAFLLASVLNRFFPLYTSINSFTQLSIKRFQQEGTWKRWPPMAGGKAVL